ncbi:GGDEF domain-containing protein [Agrobacterium tumefaciens]|uniref:GGDEF domain-containing protein n=1 Tax=Agrobacterium tumefaciens TaxID=358 RepID=UPI00287EFE6C|nr:GGDEF domain-containing protein [Agrobacterium tumefaciens]MDS7596946.1 GGDEF domain-containing protein [Agrobacterium tumefaciens]
MSQPLDLETVLLLHKLSFFVAAICFLYARSQSKESVGLGFLSIGFLLVASASTLVGIGKMFPSLNFGFVLTGNLAGMAGYAIFWIGMCRISSQGSRRGEWWILLLPVCVCAAMAFSGWYENMVARTTSFQLTAGSLLAAAAYTVIADRKLEPLPVRRPLGAAIALTAILSVVVVIGVQFPTIAIIAPRNAFFLSIICHFAIAVFILALVKERAEEGLRRLADLDLLTGVANRRSFSNRMPDTMRAGDAVAMIDIDHFKRVNDRFGHLAGDEVLAAVAAGLGGRVGVNDLFARFGGEEFVLFMPGIGKEDAMAFVAKLRAEVSAIVHDLDEHAVAVTLSAGLAVCEEKSLSAQALIKMADTALYASKAAGRDRLTFYRPEDFNRIAPQAVRQAG